MITIKYFANLREVAGKESDELTASDGMTLEDLCNQLENSQSQIVAMIRKKNVLVAINQEMASMDTPIKDGNEIAFLPPFSGGL
jgi:molybdopterin converting factor subunit 1